MTHPRSSRFCVGALAVVVSVMVAGCYQSVAADDDEAPTASSIPTAAYSAVGADYPGMGASGTGAGSTGVPECDAYFAKINDCKGLDPSARKALADSAKSLREMISKATTPSAKTAMKEVCEQASNALTACGTSL